MPDQDMPNDNALSATGWPHVKATGSVTVTVIVTAALVVCAALFVGSHLGPARIEVDAALRENAQLVARQQALRAEVFDLAEQVRWRLEERREVASQNASRLTTMQRTDDDDNVDELLKDLDPPFRRLCQSGIDEELCDVVSGFESLVEKR